MLYIYIYIHTYTYIYIYKHPWEGFRPEGGPETSRGFGSTIADYVILCYMTRIILYVAD